MNGARATATTSPAPNGVNIDAQNVTFPAEGGAIAKAVTGAYLTSGGNAFSTRTASQIVQEHFPPAPTTVGLESGPLLDRKSTRLTPVTNAHIVCRLLLEKKKNRPPHNKTRDTD